jgi:hypothetical protein
MAMTDHSDIDRRLARALAEARSSTLGMPSSVETLKAMLQRAGLALVRTEERPPKREA